MLINVNDINLNYEVYGYGKPIILLHGNGETHNIFDKLIYKLEKEYTVYAVDSRCHGKSEYTKLISYDLMAEDVIEFIKKLNIKTPILYGFSDGGIIGLLIAIKEPQLLSNLIISGANITPDATTWLDNFFTKIAYFFTRNKLIKMMLDEPNITFEELHKIAIPVHILAGEKDVIKLEHTKLIAENIKNSTLNTYYLEGDKSVPYVDVRECEIPANRIVAITGNNGAGKSTFSRCFCGLEKQCGTIIWNGKTYRPKERLKACYMVMQEVNHQLFTETIQDEVMISMKEENEKEADKFLDMLDLIKVKDRHPMSLSGGQKQRAAIASAIASGRSVLFLDEPTSGLDHKHMLEVAEVLREVWDTGISVYVITHDLELIIECCTDVIHFENGTIADQYQMDAEGMEKIRKYFIQEKCCGKWSKSD